MSAGPNEEVYLKRRQEENCRIAQDVMLTKCCSIEHITFSAPGKSCSDELMHDALQQNRRRNRRLKIGQPFRLRPTDPRPEDFEETGITKNVSRDGIYFVSQRGSYKEGMRLFVTLPYHSPSEPGDHEYVGQVTRVELFSEGQHGVAVQLLSNSTPPAS